MVSGNTFCVFTTRIDQTGIDTATVETITQLVRWTILVVLANVHTITFNVKTTILEFVDNLGFNVSGGKILTGSFTFNVSVPIVALCAFTV